MPKRSGYIASGILHLGLVLVLLFGLPNFFRHHLVEETPLVVQLVKIGPETRATKLTKTPPTPEAKPEVAEEAPPPKPEPPTPKPEPPKPKPEPPPTPAPTPPVPVAKPTPPAPPPPVPVPKPVVQAEKPIPVPAPKPTPPKPKPDQASFDALLKNLAKNDPQKSTPDQTKPVTPNRHASSQPIAPLGSQLTANELDLVKQQIYQCWNVPAGARGANDLTPEFRVSMNPDATVRAVELLNTDRYGEPFFRAAADSARRALLNPECSPLKLPLDKFNLWQTFTITFDPKDIAG